MLTRIHSMAFAALLASVAIHVAPAQSQPSHTRWRLEFLSDLNIPTGTAFEVVGNAGNSASPTADAAPVVSREDALARKATGGFGGLSGITFDEASGTLYAVSDAVIPTAFTFQLAVEGNVLRLSPRAELRLRDQDGVGLAAWSLDPEGIARLANGNLLVSSEGFVARNPPVPPAIVEFATDGTLRRRFPIPEEFLPSPDKKSLRGVRVNKGFESISVSPDGTRLFSGTEHPLHQDRPGCGVNEDCTVRLVEYSLAENPPRVVRNFRLALDPLTAPEGFRAGSGSVVGLSDILALGNDDLLAIERGYLKNELAAGDRNRIRIYHLSLDSTGSPSSTVARTLVLDLDEIVSRMTPGFQRLDNIEGICFGPTLPDGSRTILLVSDNNFSPTQRTLFLLFRLVRG